MEWIVGLIAAAIGIFAVGWSVSPRKRPGQVVSPDFGEILEDIRELDQGRADEVKRKIEEAGHGDDPFGEITDLFD